MVEYALILSLAAGLATGIGSLIALFKRKTNIVFLSMSLGISAGVMIYLSFAELLPEANEALEELIGEGGTWLGVGSFFVGVLFALIVARLVPSQENPHELHPVEELTEGNDLHQHGLRRVGVATAIVLGMHNFSEGIATFMAGVFDLNVGIAVAVAVAIHNIPEGVAVSVPIYYSTGSRKKAFWWSFLSGLAEPIGALLAWAILLQFMTPVLLNCVFAAVAGIMVFVSLDELLPAAHQYGRSRLVIIGLIIGMVAMAISLLMLHH